MNRTRNTFATVLAVLVVALLLVGGTLLLRGLARSLVSEAEYDSGRYDVTGEFTAVSVSAPTSDIYLYRSDDGRCTVFYSDTRGYTAATEVRDGVLYVTERDERSWLDKLTPGIDDYTAISVYLPETALCDLTLETVSGDVSVSDELAFASFRLTTVSGDVWLSNIRADRFDIENTSGDVSLYDTYADAYDLSTVSGDISVTLPASMDFDLHSTSGSVYAPVPDRTAGRFEAETVSGDIWVFLDEE